MTEKVKQLVWAALFLAMGLLFPFITGQIPQIGNMLLPMHIPVLLCGFICGWKYGLTVGFITPLFRSVLFGMPVFFPTAFSMAFELMTYGFVSGFLYEKAQWKCKGSIYRVLLTAMISGRVVWGIVQAILLGVGEAGITLQIFWASTIINAIPGILLQFIVVPVIVLALNHTGINRVHQRNILEK